MLCAQGARGDDISEEMFAFEQRKREVQLAVLLQQRIQPYVDAMLEGPQSPQQPQQQQQQREQQVEAWTQAMIQEARNLCQVCTTNRHAEHSLVFVFLRGCSFSKGLQKEQQLQQQQMCLCAVELLGFAEWCFSCATAQPISFLLFFFGFHQAVYL